MDAVTCTYAITVCDELEEVNRLITFLSERKRDIDNIVVLLDNTKKKAQLEILLQGFAQANIITLATGSFDGNFSEWKNKLNSLCTGEYIINIDADEVPTGEFMQGMPLILELNDIDVYGVSRSNLVEGLTKEHVTKWRWSVDEFSRVNWPDTQFRVYRNCEEIKWEGKVHERVVGFKTRTLLPDDMYFHHNKTIAKQEKQNDYYNTL